MTVVDVAMAASAAASRASYTWRPNPGPQEFAHMSPAFEMLYGGAAGGGKSEFLLMEALRYVEHPGYTAILFRRTFPELKQPRGLIERSRAIYPHFGGRYNEQTHTWRFPSGSTITFAHMEHEDDKYNHQSAEYSYIAFDELTTFTETQYLYLFSRCRNPFGIPSKIRAASNPGNVGHEWVQRRWRAWLVPIEGDGTQAIIPPKAKAGQILYYKGSEEDAAENDIETIKGDPDALSRQFIPAKLADNPKLLEADPTYRARLKLLPFVDRQRLLNGSWDVVLQGNVFKPEWFKRINYAPTGLKWYRYWDLAASVKTRADFTASHAGAMDAEANFFLRDEIHLKAEWPEVKKVIKQTMLEEPEVTHGIEKNGIGLLAVQELANDPDIAGIKWYPVEVDTDKLSRALPVSGKAEQGKIFVVEGPWVQGFFIEASIFDGSGSSHDDRIDSLSGVYAMNARPKHKRMKFRVL